MFHIARATNKTSEPLVFTNSAGTTGGFSMELYAGAMLFVSDTGEAGAPATLTFVTKISSGDETSYVVANADNEPITLVVEPGRAYALPDQLFCCTWVMATTSVGTVICQIVVKG